MTAAWQTRLQRVVIVVVLAVFPLWWLDRSMYRSARGVRGVVVMFETHPYSRGHWNTLTVRLDDGTVVRAGNSVGIPAPAGTRVELAERTGLLTGMRRYGLRRVLEDGSDDPPSW